jgi:hypothetical protein
MSFELRGGPKIIVSAYHATMRDEEVLAMYRMLDVCTEFSEPVKRVEPNRTRVWTGTCSGPVATLMTKYYAGAPGLVVVTVETIWPMSPCLQAEVDQFFEDLVLDFAGSSSVDSSSPCPTRCVRRARAPAGKSRGAQKPAC